MADTIAAIATAPGEGGIAIVRLSGDMSASILRKVFRRSGKHAFPPEDHLLCYGHVTDGDEILDECMAVLMRAPNSYTREDVVEFQVHGGFLSASRVLDVCLRSGARLAQNGEFTRRAFLNGRIDLSQAEAVMELIQARSESARKNAVHQLEGGASGFIRSLSDELYQLQAGVAACLDYPEEISEEEAVSDLGPRMLAIAARLDRACDERAARLARQGLGVALCGRPNVGKSSLLNALLGEDRAIVTSLPGTTRDLVEGEMTLGGCLIRLVDTAGVRETEDLVESVGVQRARRAAEAADLVLLVLDASQALTKEDLDLLAAFRGRDMVVLLNKTDLPPRLTEEEVAQLAGGHPVLSLSSRDPLSLEPLRRVLLERARTSDLLPLTQPRHMDAARRAAQALRDAESTLRQATLDLATPDLDRAQAALSEITGDNVEEELLDRVFSTFCVGK